MKISVLGLGYVGTVTSACLARDGHQVIGADTNIGKVELINSGRSPIIEPGIENLISKGVEQRLLQAVTDTSHAILNTEITIVCVGTPSNANGTQNLDALRKVCEEIGDALREKQEYHIVVIRSTVFPGTTRSVVIPVLETGSRKRAGIDFGVCFNPEFLREGTSLFDYDNPPKIVVGATDLKSSEILKTLFAHLSAQLFIADIEVAETVKYVDNIWHALKISFANEIGTFCKANKIDSRAVMNIFLQDTKLNISPAYLRPGFAFGGSCLPKDLRAFTYQGRNLDLDLPLLNNILRSNQAHIERAIKLIQDQSGKRIGILGISFKAETDDLRESPMIIIAETLLGRGYDLKIYDRNVRLASLAGANRDYILNVIPHIHRLMTDNIEEVLDHVQIIVIGNEDTTFAEIISKLRPGQRVVDMVRIIHPPLQTDKYTGICW